jgi:hypothetical protein
MVLRKTFSFRSRGNELCSSSPCRLSTTAYMDAEEAHNGRYKLTSRKGGSRAVVRVIQGWWLSPPCPASGMIFKQYKGSYPLVINGSPKLPVGGPMA